MSGCTPDARWGNNRLTIGRCQGAAGSLSSVVMCADDDEGAGRGRHNTAAVVAPHDLEYKGRQALGRPHSVPVIPTAPDALMGGGVPVAGATLSCDVDSIQRADLTACRGCVDLLRRRRPSVRMDHAACVTCTSSTASKLPIVANYALRRPALRDACLTVGVLSVSGGVQSADNYDRQPFCVTSRARARFAACCTRETPLTYVCSNQFVCSSAAHPLVCGLCP